MAMNSTYGPVFIDTSGWAEPAVQNSPKHQQMMDFAKHLHASQRPMVTTDDVLGELVALLTTASRGTPRPQLVQFVNQIRSDPLVQIIHVDEQIWAEGWAMLERMTDKAWSLVDATSFIVMRRLGITEAFTSDHHFTQAGFVQVPYSILQNAWQADSPLPSGRGAGGEDPWAPAQTQCKLL